MNRNKKKGTVFSICSALVFGLTPVLASLTFDMGSNAMTLTFYRNFLAVPVLFLILKARKISLRISAKEFLALALISVLFSITTTYMLYAAYDYTGVGLSTTLHFLYPMFTVLFGWIIFKQKPSRTKVFAILLATAGVALASGNSQGAVLFGVFLAVASAITYAGYLLGIEHSVVSRMDSMKAMLYICLISVIAVSILNLGQGNIVYKLAPMPMLYTFILAVANSAFAYVLMIAGIRYIGAGNAAIFSMLEPVSGVLAGMIFLHETLDLPRLFSCILILTAVLIPIAEDYTLQTSNAKKNKH